MDQPQDLDDVDDAESVSSQQHSFLSGDMNIRAVLGHILPDMPLPAELTEQDMLRILVELMSEPQRRTKLQAYNTLDDALALLRNCRKIIIITGAGVSVSCGIPDFRSKNGVYARLHADFPDLPDPQAMFDIEYFKKNPRPFFDFAREIYPGQFMPSLCHRFIKMLENNGQMLRNYTQNIDTLEHQANIQRVVQCHGSFATASCFNCRHRVDLEYVRDDIMNKRIPLCPVCPNEGEFNVLKPDITFFGESLPKEFHDKLEKDKEDVDLLIVIGSSMKVRPVSLIPNLVPSQVPQILINREPLPHMNFDIELLGNCDDIVHEICRRLGPPWNEICSTDKYSDLEEVTDLPRNTALHSAATCEKPEELECGQSLTSKSSTEQEELNSNLRSMYKPRVQKLSNCLKDNTFLFAAPSRYIFKGAEVFKECSSDDSDSSDNEDNGDLKNKEDDKEKSGISHSSDEQTTVSQK